jgi:hypothetical protein
VAERCWIVAKAPLTSNCSRTSGWLARGLVLGPADQRPSRAGQALHAQRHRRGVPVRGQGRLSDRIKVVACELLSHLAKVADSRSFHCPASTTHRQLDEEQLRKAGAGPEVIRLSIGLETAADVIADLDQALTPRAPRALPIWFVRPYSNRFGRKNSKFVQAKHQTIRRVPTPSTSWAKPTEIFPCGSVSLLTA